MAATYEACGLVVDTATASKGLIDFMKIFEPYSGKDVDAAVLRKSGFRAADPNGNGLCSLAEIETFVLASLTKAHPKDIKKKDAKGQVLEYGKDLFDLYRPCYIRAFNDAKDFKADDGKVLDGTKSATADDFVSKGEFRLMCAYLCIYAAMFDAFSKIDGGGEGRDANDDSRLEMDEWMEGYKGTTGHGFVGLAAVKDDQSALAAFQKMDADGAGMILLGEWCDFLKQAEIDAGTMVGESLNEDEEPPPKAAGGAAGGGGGGGGGAADDDEPPEVTSFGLAVGKTASQDFFDFMAIFEPYAEKSDEGADLRKGGFRSADPNGNGLCSLAELETFVLGSLVKAYPKNQKIKDHRGDPLERGKDLFDAFRPCYIRAFTDAKDYKADTGKVLEGTKSATNDDFVSRGEFRIFCAYLCIYGAMFDAFSKIDGGGEGRDANDDLRIEMDEWLAGYKGTTKHGFLGLAGIDSDEKAKEVFQKIDSDGAGMILLGEWCDYLKQVEVDAGTMVGACLAEDEDESGQAKVFEIKIVPQGRLREAKKPKKPTKSTGPKKKTLKSAVKTVMAVNAFAAGGKFAAGAPP
jgi:Ca2+-binding EF-hand superfamily protein